MVWFGDIKIQFWILCPGISGACLAGVFLFRYVDDPKCGSEDGERIFGSGILVCWFMMSQVMCSSFVKG